MERTVVKIVNIYCLLCFKICASRVSNYKKYEGGYTIARALPCECNDLHREVMNSL